MAAYFGDSSQASSKTSIESVSQKVWSDFSSHMRNASAEEKKTFDKLTTIVQRNANSEVVRSENARRDSRAAAAAVHDKVDKGISAIDKLRDALKGALDKLYDMLKSSLKESLKKYDDFARSLREKNISSADKKAAQAAATRAKNVDDGLYVAQESINSLLTNMADENNAYFRKLTTVTENAAANAANDKRINMLASLVEKQGMSTQDAIKLSQSVSDKDLDKLEYFVLQSSEGLGGKQVLDSAVKMLNSAEGQLMLQSGNAIDALNSMGDSARKLAAIGGNFTSQTSTALTELGMQMKTGVLENINTQNLVAALGITGGKINSPEEIIDSINNKLFEIQSLQQSGNEEGAERLAKQLENGLRPLFGENEQVMAEMMSSIGAAKKGNLAFENVKVGEELLKQAKQTNEENRKNGKLSDLTDSFLAGVNNITADMFGIEGGLLGNLAVNLDEMFGGSLPMNDVVSNGFALVVSLLEGIRLGQITQSIGSFFGGSGIGGMFTGVLGKAGGLFGKLGNVFSKLGPVFTNIATKGLPIAFVAGAALLAYKAIKGEIDRGDEVEAVKDEIKDKDAEIARKEAELQAAKDFNNPNAGRIEQELNALKKSREGLDKKLDEAVGNARTNNEKTYDDYVASNRLKRVSLEQEIDMFAKNAERYLAMGDAENAAKQKSMADAADKQLKEIEARNEALKDYSHTMLAAMLEPLNLEADSMLKLNKYKDLIYSIVLGLFGPIGKIGNDIRLITTNWDKITAKIGSTIGSILPTAQDFRDTISNGIDKAKDLKATISKGVDNFKTKISNVINPFKDFFKLEWLPQSIKNFIFGGGKEAASKSSWIGNIGNVITTTFKNIRSDFKNWWNDFKLFANGGVVGSATKAVVGEAGKEVIFPLTKPDQIRNVFSQLSNNEKFLLLKELLKSNQSFSITSLSSVLYNILTNKDKLYKQSGTSNRELVSGDVTQTDLTRKIIEGAAAQKGHTYSEMVCNQLVEAALKYAGFPLPTRGVVTKHFNNDKMRLVLNDPIKGISPTDPALVPGMIMFSHPFTQEEADQLNAQKGGKRKAGDPGHMGIYAGNGLWWNSTSSKSTYDYSSGEKIKFTESGVALTKPMTTGTYKLYAAGYYDGMFDSSVTGKLPTANKKSTVLERATEQTKQLLKKAGSGQPSVKGTGLLSTNEMMTILNEAGIRNAPIMSSYIEQAKKLLASGSDKENIIVLLTEIARYLRSMSINKNTAVPVSRPPAATYGVSGAAR